MVDYTFVVQKMCPVCNEMTHVVKTRSRLVVEKRDEDLCVHYKNFNPYYYKIWVCENCGYAADEKTFLSVLPKNHRNTIWEFVHSHQFDVEFSETRTFPDAVASYQLALAYLEMIKGSPCKRATLTLNLAWMYRFVENHEKEQEYMLKAAELYDISLAQERYPIDGMSDGSALYVIGAIYYRLGFYDKCTQYLSRIISDQDLRNREPRVYDKARDLWGDVRSNKKSR